MLQKTYAIIEHAKKILICQRSASMKFQLKWELPGGKIETREARSRLQAFLIAYKTIPGSAAAAACLIGTKAHLISPSPSFNGILAQRIISIDGHRYILVN